jgi:hypothetical protein
LFDGARATIGAMGKFAIFAVGIVTGIVLLPILLVALIF